MDRVIDVKTHSHLMPGRLFDANGQEVRHVISANLDTGECLVSVRDGDRPKVDEKGWAVRAVEHRPAPLAFVSTKGT